MQFGCQSRQRQVAYLAQRLASFEEYQQGGNAENLVPGCRLSGCCAVHAGALKQWKMSPVDEAAVSLWSEYTRAKEAMFFYTDTADCPWTIIKSDDKKRARLNCMQHFLHSLDYPDKDHDVVGPPDPLIVGSPSQVIRRDVHLDDWPHKQSDETA